MGWKIQLSCLGWLDEATILKSLVYMSVMSQFLKMVKIVKDSNKTVIVIINKTIEVPHRVPFQ